MLNYLAVGADEILLFTQSFYKQYYKGGGGGYGNGTPARFCHPIKVGNSFILYIHSKSLEICFM